MKLNLNKSTIDNRYEHSMMMASRDKTTLEMPWKKNVQLPISQLTYASVPSSLGAYKFFSIHSFHFSILLSACIVQDSSSTRRRLHGECCLHRLMIKKGEKKEEIHISFVACSLIASKMSGGALFPPCRVQCKYQIDFFIHSSHFHPENSRWNRRALNEFLTIASKVIGELQKFAAAFPTFNKRMS